jgi:hypothetical protein
MTPRLEKRHIPDQNARDEVMSPNREDLEQLGYSENVQDIA